MAEDLRCIRHLRRAYTTVAAHHFKDSTTSLLHDHRIHYRHVDVYHHSMHHSSIVCVWPLAETPGNLSLYLMCSLELRIYLTPFP